MWWCHQHVTPPVRGRVQRTAAVQMCCWSVCRTSCRSVRVTDYYQTADQVKQLTVCFSSITGSGQSSHYEPSVRETGVIRSFSLYFFCLFVFSLSASHPKTFWLWYQIITIISKIWYYVITSLSRRRDIMFSSCSVFLSVWISVRDSVLFSCYSFR